jgi:cytochrome c-type biogenesis protein CcmH/NrfF
VGCPASPGMLAELSAAIARGDSDDAILHQFQAEYGPVIIASPRFTRFNHLAWIMPPLVLFLGIAAVLLIVRNWKLHTVPTPPEPTTPGFAATRDRIRRETQI